MAFARTRYRRPGWGQDQYNYPETLGPLLESSKVLLRGSTYSGSGNWIDEISAHSFAPVGDPTFSADHWIYDGTNDGHGIALHTDFDFSATEDFTFAIDFAPGTINNGVLFSNRGTTLTGSVGYSFEQRSDGTLRFEISDGTLETQMNSAGTPLSDGVRGLAIFRRDASEGDMKMRYAGTDETDDTEGGTKVLTGSTNIRAGQTGGGFGDANILLYNVVMWRRLLTNAECDALGTTSLNEAV